MLYKMPEDRTLDAVENSSGVFDYEALFPFVNKPSRYIGQEWNSILKPESFRRQAVGVCLCFPDLYETGFANTGIEILYQVVNRRGDAFAERAYAVDRDLAALLRKEGAPLFSLESRTPLARFDIVGFGLPYELCYTNILEMLDLAQIPLKAAERKDNDPLVIGGGPCSVNPEPLADFLDAVVLGDGEEVIGEIVETVRRHKEKGAGRERRPLLLDLARLPGVYVPSLYNVRYLEDGCVAEVKPAAEGVPASVAYRRTQFMLGESDAVSLPLAPVVPYVQTVHDRLNVEIQRGCPWRCRFCQAGFSYRPYRERSAEELVVQVEKGLQKTGYDAVTLAGLSAADHSEIIPLLATLAERLTPKRVSIGLPSTRADRFTLALAEVLNSVRRQSVTFAPEAGTERMRRVIRKELQESEIRETIRTAHRHGWKTIKLYFMFGLPTEKEEDLQGIADLIRAAKRDCPGLAFTLTLSPFVPKPHTPYQWHPQEDLEVLRRKQIFLKKHLPAQIRAHGLEQIVLEGMLSRGDRRTGRLLETAWRMGAGFDEWGERFQWPLWQKAFQATGLDPAFYCSRERGKDELFPWDHLQGGPEKRALWNDYQSALRQSSEPLPEHPHLKERPQVPGPKRVAMSVGKTVQRLRFRMSRRGPVRFLSHLEQIEMVRRSLRRSGLPLTFTEGFHPQMRCAFGPAVSVGYESDCEYFDVDLAARADLKEAEARLAAEMPPGFTLLKVARIPLFFPSLESLLNGVEYSVTVPAVSLRGRAGGELHRAAAAFLEGNPVLEKVKKGRGGTPRAVRIPLKPILTRMAWEEPPAPEGQGRTLLLSMKFGPGQSVKPEKVAGMCLNLSEEEVRRLIVRRRELLIVKADGSSVQP